MQRSGYLDELRIMAGRRIRERRYWLEKFSGEPLKSAFPYDFKKTGGNAPVPDAVQDRLSMAVSRTLIELSNGSDVRLHVILTSILVLILHLYTGEEDIIVGTPIFMADGEGDFSNTVIALRNRIAAGITFKELLFEVRQTVAGAVKNQCYPIEILIEDLDLPCGEGNFPLFDAGLIVENIQKKEHLNVAAPNMVFCFLRAGEAVDYSLEYNTRLYAPVTARRIMNHFKVLLEAVLTDIEMKISSANILSEQEKNQILYDFNDKAAACPGNRTIHELFDEQAKKNPDGIALVGTTAAKPPGRGSGFFMKEQVTVSYGRLDFESDRLAERLRQEGVGPDAIVALSVERSIGMIVAIFAILKTGGAYLPIEPQSPEARKLYMLKESKTRWLLTTRHFPDEVAKLEALSLSTIFIEEDDKQENRAGGDLIPHTRSVTPAGAENLAYIIYTSGTTGNPKGILTRHSNVIRVVADTDYIAIDGADKVMQLSNYAFDGSVFDMFGALLNGAALVLVEKERAAAVDLLADLILREKITVFFATTALFNALVELKIECFETVRKVLFGGERVSSEHSKKALEYMGKGRIVHLYGPTETTVFATYYPIAHIEDRDLTVPIGRPIANTSLFVLDKNLRPQPIGVQGELYIGGAGVARGYLNRPELTAERFIKNPYAPPSAPIHYQSLFYKTGDLVRWNFAGYVEFLGRVDTQVKVRGFRIELGEIESRLLSIPGIVEALVLDKEYESGDRYLCAYVVAKENEIGTRQDKKPATLTPVRIRKHLSGDLPDYMVPAYIIFLKKMPLTPNGKIDRKALPEPEIRAEGIYVAPRDDVEKRLVKIWSSVLGINEDKIGIDDNFFELGGHSLKATKLSFFIRREFEINMELKDIFTAPSIRESAQLLNSAESSGYNAISPVEKKEYYELSYNQKRLWVIHQMEPESPAFNMPAEFSFRHKVDITALKTTLLRLTERHAGLRTKFEKVNEEPIQIIIRQLEIPFKQIDISAQSEEKKKDQVKNIFATTATSPFTLTEAPLFRTVLVKLAEEYYEFIFNMHHIISDGWSMEIIKTEFFLLYDSYRTGKKVEPEALKLEYKDFCEWTNKRIEEAGIKKKSHEFWKRKLAGGLPVLELPVSSTGNKENLQGAAYMAMIDEELSTKLKKTATAHNTTLFVVLFSLYILMLHRFTMQKDIACSIISAGREHLSLHNIIGFFVNSLLFRTEVHGKESFGDFLQRMRGNVLETFQNQGYPLELICRDLKIQYPEIAVSFNMLNVQERAGEHLDSFEPYHIEEVQDVKFDLEPYVTVLSNGINMYWVYRRRLLDPSFIEHMVNEYIKLIDFFTGDPGRSYDDYRKRKKKQTFKRG